MLIVIAILALAGVTYFIASGSSGSSGASSTTTTTRQASSTTKATSSIGSGSSQTTAARTSITTASASGMTTYSVTFNYSQPLGPFGERVLPNDTVQTYSSVQVASGTFTFFISATNRSGSGSGHGTLTVTTTGFCSGTTTVPYTFQIPDATTLLGNLTVFMGTPTPGNFSVPLTCTGPMQGVSTTTNDPAPFLSTYPNELTIATVPYVINQHQTGNIDYYFDIVQTS